jgi:uncharacterized protein YdaT
MNISGANNQILTQATKAYNNFESFQIPFAAVKLNVCLQNSGKKEIDELIEDNFRSEKDLLFKKDKNYFILMQRTSIEAAERAVNRLKAKIGQITRNCESLKDHNHNHAAAYILGSIRGTKRMHIKYIDLNPNFNSFDRKTHKIPFGYSEYLRWLQVPKTESLKINQMINIVV